MTAEVAWPLTIYYDRACPLCERELGTLAACDRDARLGLVDCSAPDFHDTIMDAAGLERADLLRAIHARDAAGRWYRGIEVFALAYEAAGLTRAARLFAHPRLRPFWDWLYPHIARHRMFLSRLGIAKLYAWLIVQGSRPTPRASSSAK